MAAPKHQTAPLTEKRVRVAITGKTEDLPRLLTAYTRIARVGEFALVLKPAKQACVYAVTSSEGAFLNKPQAGSDGPDAAEVKTTASKAQAALRRAQKGLGRQGKATLRGTWVGQVTFRPGRVPLVELRRKIASYGTLHVVSEWRFTGSWTWRFERAAKWFAEAGEQKADASYATLEEAIRAGFRGALGLVQEACGKKDTSRRAAFDEEYAEKRPIKHYPPPKRDPIDRYKGFLGRKPKAVHDGSPMPTSAPDPATQAEVVDAVRRDAEGILARLDAFALAPEQLPTVEELIRWFEGHEPAEASYGFDDVAERIHLYANGQLCPMDRPIPLDDFLAELTKALIASAKSNRKRVDASPWKEARGQLVVLRDVLETAPHALARTRALIRYATAMARSQSCKGADRKAALEHIGRAVDAYEEARSQILGGGACDVQKTQRMVAQEVALAAARAAVSCSGNGPRHQVGKPLSGTPPIGTIVRWKRNVVLCEDGRWRAFTAEGVRRDGPWTGGKDTTAVRGRVVLHVGQGRVPGGSVLERFELATPDRSDPMPGEPGLPLDQGTWTPGSTEAPPAFEEGQVVELVFEGKTWKGKVVRVRRGGVGATLKNRSGTIAKVDYRRSRSTGGVWAALAKVGLRSKTAKAVVELRFGTAAATKLVPAAPVVDPEKDRPLLEAMTAAIREAILQT